MDNEMRAAFATLTESMLAMKQELKQEMTAGFARADRYFELQQAQYLDLSARVDALTQRVDALTDRFDRLEREVVLLRDFVTREITDIRVELRALRLRTDQSDEMRREVEALAARIDALERRQQD